MVFCLPCFGRSAVPPDHTELSRDELKALYHKSIALNGGRLIVHGIFARADTKNNNKRVYPKHILKREVEKFEREHITRGTALGELDHPNYASRYFKCLNLPNISHQVLDVEWRGDQLWGSIEILPTPSGLLLWELYSQGIKLGVSSRGWASLRTDPKRRCVYVDDDFELITFDFVTEPSTKGAFLVPIWKAYRRTVPNQSKSVQLSHLGHGVCSLEQVPKLPQVKLLAARINYLQEQSSGVPPTAGLQAKSDLDTLLLYSHYIVFQELQYLDREKHARDFHSHLAMFATRAHLSNQAQFMNRADLNTLIMQEIAKEEVDLKMQSQSMRMSPSLGNIPPPEDEDCGEPRGDHAAKRFTDAECQGQPVDDLRSWSLRPSSQGSASRGKQMAAAPYRAHSAKDGAESSAGGPGGRSASSQAGSLIMANPGRVHPAPSRNAQQQPQQPPSDVELEFQRIKATLASYAAKYQQRHQALQDALDLALPQVASNISLRGAQAAR